MQALQQYAIRIPSFTRPVISSPERVTCHGIHGAMGSPAPVALAAITFRIASSFILGSLFFAAQRGIFLIAEPCNFADHTHHAHMLTFPPPHWVVLHQPTNPPLKKALYILHSI